MKAYLKELSIIRQKAKKRIRQIGSTLKCKAEQILSFRVINLAGQIDKSNRIGLLQKIEFLLVINILSQLSNMEIIYFVQLFSRASNSFFLTFFE